MKRVKSDYVEPIDDSELLESAIRGMVSDLDPHSQFLDADEYRDIRISTTGSYTGIGIEVTEVDGDIRVITPIAGSPAARSGIRSGDQIIAVDGIMVDRANRAGHYRADARAAPARVSPLQCCAIDDTIDHKMRREVIRVASVHYESLEPSYGYVRAEPV